MTDERGFPPTVEELTDRLQMRKSLVHSQLNRLIQRGLIRKTPGKARGMEVVRSPHAQIINMVAVPLLGCVPAGRPIFSEEHPGEDIQVPSKVVGGATCFALKVVGSSMRDVDILDGDVVIVRQQPLAEDGDIIVASVDGEVTVKQLSMRDGVIQLLPANDEFQPIRIEPKTELRVLGKVIAAQRLLTRVR